MLPEDPVYCSPSHACHSAARLNAGLAPEETVEIPSHVTRGQFGADIDAKRRSIPKRAVNEEDAERCPKELTPSGLAYAGISTVS
jgi:hypothetical protein